MEKTREMPHDLLAEKSLLGCLLIDSSAIDEISDVSLIKEDFYHPQYALIYSAIRDLHFQSQPIDLVTVCSKLNDIGKIEVVGGQTAILNLIEDQASSANVYHYAKVIKDKSIIREIIKTAGRVVEGAHNFSGDITEYINEVESSFFKLTSQTKNEGLKDLKNILKLNLKSLENAARNKGEVSGLPTGFKEIDKRLLGLQPGQLVVLAARPAMGKTALALNFAVNAAKSSALPVAIFSLEMLSPELGMRILSSEAAIDATRLKTKNFLDSDLKNIATAVQELTNLPLFINDAADITLVDIRSQCRKIKIEQGLALVVIDYLQLMQSHTNSIQREQQISEISRGLKNLAKELECPVVALSQLNRAVESRVDKRPMVSDLRESGSIEQDADIVMLVYRDEVYNKETKDKGIAEIIVGKNRSGETGTVKLAWIGSQTKFANLAYEPNNY
ncbi:MAG: replicative DNA helicase [Bacteriovoracaceae bacterium]|nr:replicative DNA helicase [Bacteriovoracaceae bacterium]